MSENKKSTFHYGGQAVIEGVMMRGKDHFAVACRRENKEIVVSAEPIESSILGRLKWLNKPFFRGTLAMLDTMILGAKTLMFSADIAMQDAEAAEAKSGKAKNGSKDVPLESNEPVAEVSEPVPTETVITKADKKGKSVNEMTLNITLAVGLLIGVAIFLLVPTALTMQLKRVMDHPNRLLFGVIEGLIKITLFVGYIWAISRMEDVRRIFQYHGAEHSTINAYEAGEELTVENVKRYTTIHPRCGTSFMLIVLVTSILVFTVIPWHTILQRFLLKFLLLPVVAGIGYEVIKLAGSRKDSRLLRTILAPGLLVQRITTQPPTPDQIEVAITALKSVFETEKAASEPAVQSASETHH